ncbi:MAG: WhiB family transcriptional regulator [Candidatus Nanopelagicales bacterium]
MTWHTEAACRDTDPDTFYPQPEAPIGRPTTGKPDPYAAARTICAQCPVRDQCLQEAMTEESGHGAHARHGMRGGLSPSERYRLPWRICRRCGNRFATSNPRNMTCSAECYELNRREAVERYQAKLREANAVRVGLTDTVCWCGFESRTMTGLAQHQRKAHEAAA